MQTNIKNDYIKVGDLPRARKTNNDDAGIVNFHDYNNTVIGLWNGNM